VITPHDTCECWAWALAPEDGPGVITRRMSCTPHDPGSGPSATKRAMRRKRRADARRAPRPARSTTTLALGSRQLSAQGAIVTRLTAIEEMAGMTVLCSDKTGTLTLNQMVIQARQTLKPGPNPKAPRSGARSSWATAPRLALR